MILGFEGGNELSIGLELDQVIKTCGLVLDGISELTQAPILLVHNLTTVVGDKLDVLGNRFLHLGTYDGMALAQAVIEYVHEKIGSITLFSTHYHELTALDKTLKRLKNIHVSAKDDKNTLVFLHKVVDGPTDKSYGINVAKLAHLPNQVINRAQQILNYLEETKGKTEIEMDLFNFSEDEKVEIKETPEVIQILNDINADDLSPREALSLIYELKRKINE